MHAGQDTERTHMGLICVFSVLWSSVQCMLAVGNWTPDVQCCPEPLGLPTETHWLLRILNPLYHYQSLCRSDPGVHRQHVPAGLPGQHRRAKPTWIGRAVRRPAPSIRVGPHVHGVGQTMSGGTDPRLSARAALSASDCLRGS